VQGTVQRVRYPVENISSLTNKTTFQIMRVLHVVANPGAWRGAPDVGNSEAETPAIELPGQLHAELSYVLNKAVAAQQKDVSLVMSLPPSDSIDGNCQPAPVPRLYNTLYATLAGYVAQRILEKAGDSIQAMSIQEQQTLPLLQAAQMAAKGARTTQSLPDLSKAVRYALKASEQCSREMPEWQRDESRWVGYHYRTCHKIMEVLENVLAYIKYTSDWPAAQQALITCIHTTKEEFETFLQDGGYAAPRRPPLPRAESGTSSNTNTTGTSLNNLRVRRRVDIDRAHAILWAMLLRLRTSTTNLVQITKISTAGLPATIQSRFTVKASDADRQGSFSVDVPIFAFDGMRAVAAEVTNAIKEVDYHGVCTWLPDKQRFAITFGRSSTSLTFAGDEDARALGFKARVVSGSEIESTWSPQHVILDAVDAMTAATRMLHMPRGPYQWYQELA
jgi:hypothetical protein